MTIPYGQGCICGCGHLAVAWHHVVYQQHLRLPPSVNACPPWGENFKVRRDRDPRNLVPVAFHCHGAHHGRSKPFSLDVLPDSVFSFASEVLGAGAAYEYLKLRYVGGDPRLDALLEEWAA